MARDAATAMLIRMKARDVELEVMTDGIERKSQHLDIVLRRDGLARGVTTGFESVRFEHAALPEMALADVDLSTTFLNRRLNAPLLISSMTGGPQRAEAINLAIAEASQHLKIAFGVGSQRVALQGEGAALARGGFSRQLRDVAPDVPLLANIGGAQLAGSDGIDMARRAVDMIGADAIIVHLNPLQEVVQPEGDRDWRGVLAALETLQRGAAVPVIVKEVGAGISGATAKRLGEAGIRIIDVAGAGGTSWAAVDAERSTDERAKTLAHGRQLRDPARLASFHQTVHGNAPRVSVCLGDLRADTCIGVTWNCTTVVETLLRRWRGDQQADRCPDVSPKIRPLYSDRVGLSGR